MPKNVDFGGIWKIVGSQLEENRYPTVTHFKYNVNIFFSVLFFYIKETFNNFMNKSIVIGSFKSLPVQGVSSIKSIYVRLVGLTVS